MARELIPLTGDTFWMVIVSDMFMTNDDREGIRQKYAPRFQLPPELVKGEAPNDNSKAVGDFTRVLEENDMLDQDGFVRRD